MERTTNQPVDDGAGGTVEKTITQSGFDISGADLLMLGTLYKNITFGFVPTIADGEGVGIETAFVRFDNLFKSRWANLKVGKFELDNMLSEKRGMMLSSNGAFYQSYHFVPGRDATDFGLGDNQIGAEWLGHSANSYTRFSVAVLGGDDGAPGLPRGKSYDGTFTAEPGLRRRQARSPADRRRTATSGQRPTTFETSGGEPIPGTGTDNKSFYRIGVVGDFFLGKLRAAAVRSCMAPTTRTSPAGPGTPPGTAGSSRCTTTSVRSWSSPSGTRSSGCRSRRDPATPKTLGNIDAYTFGYRWYPIMFSRAGLAMVGELSFTKTIGTVPLSGDGVGLDPLTPGTAVWSTSVLLALDFDF